MQEFIIKIMNDFGYFGMVLLIAVENIFPPIPSEAILTFGGFMTTYTDMKVVYVIIAATAGSVIGAVTLYFIGKWISNDKIIKGKTGKMLRLKEEDIEVANTWFSNHGKATIFFCRFIPIVRSLISIPAGMQNMEFLSFVILTLLGSGIWNTVLIYGGKCAGDSWPAIVEFITEYYRGGVAIIVLIGIGYVVCRKMSKKR